MSKNLSRDEIINEVKGSELNRKEAELIYYIRTKYRFGDIIIKTHDGLPFRILKVTEYQELDN